MDVLFLDRSSIEPLICALNLFMVFVWGTTLVQSKKKNAKVICITAEPSAWPRLYPNYAPPLTIYMDLGTRSAEKSPVGLRWYDLYTREIKAYCSIRAAEGTTYSRYVEQLTLTLLLLLESNIQNKIRTNTSYHQIFHYTNANYN